MEMILLVSTIIAILSPLIGAFVSLSLKKWTSIRDIFGVLTIAISAIAAIIVYAVFAQGDGTAQAYDFNWLSWSAGADISRSTNVIQSGFYLDSLSVMMGLIVSVLSMLIAFFSLEYMGGDKFKARYWFFIQLFVSGMLLLVFAHDMIFLFIGWEIVGLCSCFLIAHHYMKEGDEGKKPALSGIKALIMTGIGDVGFLAFLSWAYFTSGSLFVDELFVGSNTIIMSILLLLAPITKSAQFPLQSWLSAGDTVDIDAMQGPTTVSALIHAATMVKAGVYLVARLSPIWNVDFFYIVLMIIAGISTVLAAIGALVTTDLKRVLAYSTISQLSYMFLAFTLRETGDGLLAGQLHLFSHSIFKALLFLSAGAIIHSVAEERDIKKMGGLRKELPWIYGFMLVGVIGLMGLPIVANGGYSKELIITAAYLEGNWFVFIVTVLTAFLTALYASRMFFMIFHGKNRGAHVHKPKYIMRITLGILAVLVVVTGFIIEGPLHNFLTGHHDPYVLIHVEYAPFFIALGAILLGIGLAYLLYGKGQTEVGIIEKTKAFKAVRTFVANGFYIDHLYNIIFVKPVFWIGQKLSFLKTGKLNWNMILGSILATAAIVILVVVVV